MADLIERLQVAISHSVPGGHYRGLLNEVELALEDVQETIECMESDATSKQLHPIWREAASSYAAAFRDIHGLEKEL